MQTAEQIQKVAVTLPDGSVRDYDAPVTGLQIAESIGALGNWLSIYPQFINPSPASFQPAQCMM